MTDEQRVQHLLDEVLDSDRTPEEVCAAFPELLGEVHRRRRRIRQVESELEALFPRTVAYVSAGTQEIPGRGADLPRIAGYEVVAVLGRGGMGVVYKARQLKPDRLVALKMLLAGAYAGPAERARFLREAEAVAGQCHPNIVQVYEVGDHEGRPYFTMELVDGGTLAQKLAAAPPAAQWAAELVVSLAEAVSVAHGAGIVHRDLKPSNVLLTAAGTPKISDFGVARRLAGEAALTATGTTVGTPRYMAPEQAGGTAGPVGPAADVYGLGAVLYELLTGRPPFDAESALETFRQVLEDEPVPPSRLNPRVPRDLETVCLKCLHKEPPRRYASAAALAEDLRRYLLGQVVAARPVGRLERAARWIRRNATVASLSAATALALVAATVVSLLYAADARRKADELERQTIQLKVQTRAAQENAQRAEESDKEVTRVLLSGMLMPIGRNPHQFTDPLDAAEADAVRQLRAAPAPVRLQFLETALRDPEAARRVGRRADWIVQAVVGFDRARRADAARLVVQRIQEPGEPQEVRLACARLGLALNLADRAWAERSADALLAEMRDPLVEPDDYVPLVEALDAVNGRLPPTQAADHAARALDAFLPRLRGPVNQAFAHQQLGQAVVTISPWLDAAAATRAAEALGATIRQSDSNQYVWPSLCMALAAVCRRLPPSDAADHVNRTVDFITETSGATKEKDQVQYVFRAQALGALCGRLDADRAFRAASAVLAILGDTQTSGTVRYEFISNRGIASVLPELAERLDTAGGLRAAEGLVLVLRKSENIILAMEQLRAAIAAVCRRLDAAGAARVAEAIAAAVRDPNTSVLVRTLFPDALVALADRLTSEQAASLESALVDSLLADLADAKSRQFRGLVGQALATACGRPSATGAARAAEALTAALRDAQTPLESLKPLAAALVAVGGRLPAKEVSSHANQAVDALDSLWVARTAPLARASLAEALAALWTRLEPADAAARAKRTAADLDGALRDSKAVPHEYYRLAEALAAVCNHLDPAERGTRANAAADTLVAALRKPKSDLLTIYYLSEALTTLCAHLDQPGVVRVADALLTELADPNVQQFRFAFHERMLKKVSARLDERDLQRLLEHPLAVSRLQRVLLDFLAASKNRTFRNTWDYLDSTESMDQ